MGITNDQKGITCAKSLFRWEALKLLTHFVKGRRIATKTTLNEFVCALKTKFGDTDIGYNVRSKLKSDVTRKTDWYR